MVEAEDQKAFHAALEQPWVRVQEDCSSFDSEDSADSSMEESAKVVDPKN